MVYVPTFTTKNQPFNVSERPNLNPIGSHGSCHHFRGFELCLRQSKKKRLEIPPWEMYKTTQLQQAFFMAPSLYTLNIFAREKHTCFYNSLLKTEEQWNDITSGSVKTSVAVGKMIREVKGPLLTFTIRILSDCYSVWPGPNVYRYVSIIVYNIHTYLFCLYNIYIYIYLYLHTYNTGFLLSINTIFFRLLGVGGLAPLDSTATSPWTASFHRSCHPIHHDHSEKTPVLLGKEGHFP